ncbi:hypothetical protein Hanom_Chr01g00058651 [Helianthus anomalus]
MVPSDLCFTVKTQRHPTGFFPGGRVHFSQVSFFFRASISVLIAFSQFSYSKACFTLVGVCSEYNEETNALAS